MKLFYIEHGDLDDVEEGDLMRAVIAADHEYEARTLACFNERWKRKRGWSDCLCAEIGTAKKGAKSEIVLGVTFGPNR